MPRIFEEKRGSNLSGAGFAGGVGAGVAPAPPLAGGVSAGGKLAGFTQLSIPAAPTPAVVRPGGHCLQRTALPSAAEAAVGGTAEGATKVPMLQSAGQRKAPAILVVVAAPGTHPRAFPKM